MEVARFRHERESLSVGLNFLDEQQTGSVGPNKCPELLASLFVVLDPDNDGYISHHELQGVVEKLTKELDAKLDRIRQLQREIDEVLARPPSHAHGTVEYIELQVAYHKGTIDQLKGEVEEHRSILQAIFNYFHAAFVKHVFGHTLDEIPNDTISIVELDRQLLLRRLEEVEKEATTDVLSIETPRLGAIEKKTTKTTSGTGRTNNNNVTRCYRIDRYR